MRPLSVLLLFAVTLTVSAGVSRGGDRLQTEDVKAVFAQADANGDGEIDLCEFHARMVEVFYSADTDKSGFLSPDEYGRLPFSGEFKDADPASKGRISLHDFIAVRYRQFVEADRNHDAALSLSEVIDAYEGRQTP